MSDVNFLEIAQSALENVTGSTPEEETIAAAQVSQAAALIALVEETRNHNTILHNATTIDGSIKVDLSHPVEQALIALTEQAKRIADALNSIDTVLVNASGAGGAIKIDDGVDR